MGVSVHPKYPNVFSPIRLGPIELPNRFYSSPHAVPMTIGSKPSDDYLHYILARVKGGCALTVDGSATTTPGGTSPTRVAANESCRTNPCSPHSLDMAVATIKPRKLPSGWGSNEVVAKRVSSPDTVSPSSTMHIGRVSRHFSGSLCQRPSVKRH